MRCPLFKQSDTGCKISSDTIRNSNNILLLFTDAA